MDAATRTRLKRERSRLTMLRLGITPGQPLKRGPVLGRPAGIKSGNRDRSTRKVDRPLPDSYEAWVAEVECAIAAHKRSTKETACSNA